MPFRRKEPKRKPMELQVAPSVEGLRTAGGWIDFGLLVMLRHERDCARDPALEPMTAMEFQRRLLLVRNPERARAVRVALEKLRLIRSVEVRVQGTAAIQHFFLTEKGRDLARLAEEKDGRLRKP